MAKQLSEAEAWRLIATRVVRGTPFLCHRIGLLPGRVGSKTRDAMRARIKRHLRGAYTMNELVYGVNEEYSDREAREVRVLAALWLALEAEDEALSASSQVVGGEKR